MTHYGLPEYDADSLTAARETAAYFEACLNTCNRPKQAANWIMGALTALLNARGLGIDRSPISPEGLAGLILLIDQGTISGKIAKTVFEEMARSGKAPGAIVKEKGLVQVSDTAAIESAIDDVLAANPDEAAAYRQGKTKLLGFFVGQVMKATRGKANPKLVNQLLKQKLEG